MFARKKRATSSPHIPRCKVALETLASLQPLLLLQILMGASQAMNSSLSRSRALARTLLLSGQQRVHALLSAAPSLYLPVEQLLAFCQSSDEESTPEEDAAQALLELCLGLMLQLLARNTRRAHTTIAQFGQRRISSSYPLSFPLLRPRKIRSGPSVSLT
jgi:hypothetical protein